MTEEDMAIIKPTDMITVIEGYDAMRIFLSIACGTREARREENGKRVPRPLGGRQAACLVSCLGSSLTSIFFGSGLAGFGIVIFKTPFDMVACTLDGSMPGGNCSTR